MPELLKQTYREQLTRWIGRTCHFKLLYKISRDGCSASTFHQKCDGQGPTVTVLYNTNDTIFGGYLSQRWNSSGNYISDTEAFLFRLQYNGSSSNPLKAPVNGSNYDYAGYGHSNYDPTFGGNYDLRSFQGNISKSGKEFALNGSVYMSDDYYNYNGQNTNSMTNNNLKVTDLEVYLVVDGPGPKLTDKPWREPPEWNETSQKLKQSLIDYKPMAESNVSAANILLIGQIGAGKSSFFNSVNSIFRGKITSKASSGSFEHSVTTAYRQYKIKDFTSGKFLNFRLCDTRGLEEEFAMDVQEISFILDGNIPDRYQFNPMVPFTSNTPGYIKDPDLQDKIHCVAFVIDGSSVDVMPDKVRKQIKDLQVRLNHRNLPQVVLLTKLDKICPDVDEDIKNTFTSSAISDAVERVADMMGLPRGHVLPVKNYESETKLKTGVDILVMEALQQCLDFADDFIDEQPDKMASEGKKAIEKD